MKRSALALWCALVIPGLVLSAENAKPDPWESVRFLLGNWQGTTEGEPGKGTVARSYELVLGDRFIHERNTSTYPPQEKNAKGETHQHWSFISYDRIRKTLVLRQFHTEGFVNQYRRGTQSADGKQIVFESEAFENLGGQWRAKEIYDVLGPDEFTETFQLAQPGKDFQTYSINRFKRVAR
jgi:hypothetical protein